MLSTANQNRISFLDANALLDLFVYQTLCGSHSLDLGQCQDFNELKAILERATPPFPLKREDLRPLEHGITLFHQMRQRTDDWDFFTSRFCLSEMQHALLEEQASQRLLASKVPFRLTRHRPLIVYRRALTQGDYADLRKALYEFLDTLKVDHQIFIQVAEDGAVNLSTLALVAETIWSHVLFDVMDTFIYASAVISMADVLITGDGAFLDAITNLHAPSNDEWRAIRQSLDIAIGAIQIDGFSWPQGRPLKSPFP